MEELSKRWTVVTVWACTFIVAAYCMVVSPVPVWGHVVVAILVVDSVIVLMTFPERTITLIGLLLFVGVLTFGSKSDCRCPMSSMLIAHSIVLLLNCCMFYLEGALKSTKRKVIKRAIKIAGYFYGG